ncbi:MAG: phosphodiester glycosidase family protein [Burkholderiales bacterium]|nr:MAG: phosphodiester glycosidase family protein [Burkholderiales bacterium]
MRRHFLHLVSLAGLLVVTACASPRPSADLWQTIVPGLSHRAWSPLPDSEVHVLRVDLTRLRLTLTPPAEAGQPLDVMRSARGALASVNASFFDREFRPRGLTVSDGQPWPALIPMTAPAADPLLACDTRCVIRFDAPATPDPAWRLVVSGTPWLVRDGLPRSVQDDTQCPSFCAQPHPRTAVGLDASGRHLLLLLAAGRRGDVKGLTLAETAALMRDLGAAQAFNLDGGGSSTLLIEGQSVLPRPFNEPTLRQLANALVIDTPEAR